MSVEELRELRAELDQVDAQLVPLLERRLALSDRVAACKQRNGLAVLDAGREQQVLETRAALAAPENRVDIQALYVQVMAVSRQRQQRRLEEAQHV